ncbi:MAG: TIGR04282 family arsenosugar biosynthesis glycosyltransferase [Proteobacteria bacterium]|nr:TIGR04282 family arsenosugar biosynthesis glycosyltransferase [Pseudomonadota bacterium]MBU1686896.1 TIGR04282 family arsenosugar biosynthesis glycosyltransferase [Pseudomonadota bacterium]
MNHSVEKRLLVVVAKEPVAGKVKTRLSPAFTPEEAANLYQCMIADRLREISGLANIDLAIAYTPSNAKATFIPLASTGFDLFAQRGKDIGERLHNIFIDAFAAGYGAVSIVDSDSPDLPKSIILESFRLIQTNGTEVVFGPCHDGGYYLVGMQKPHPELFENIPWSTSAVLEVTLAKAGTLGFKATFLPYWNDLDTFDDLVVFYKRLSENQESSNQRGKKTLAFLARCDSLNKK